MEDGFTNEFWETFEEVNGSAEFQKWTIKRNKDEDPNNGIWNCDSDYSKDESDALVSIHQVYFKTLNPEIEDLEKRADFYKLWPKV